MKNSIPKTLVLLLILTLPNFFATAQQVNIDFNTKHQIIRGFGGIHINSWTGRQLTADMQEKAFDNDPGEIGLSIFRMRIDPDSNAWNAELPIAQYATSKGAIVFASPWNPPSNMRAFLRETPNGNDNYLLPEFYADYAQHLNKYVDFMNNNGVPLYAISVQNEPDWHGWTWWEPSQMLNFVRNHAQNINCRVIAPESLGYVRKMIDPLLNDSTANSHIDILGTHLYGTPKANFYYPLAYEKNKEIWMTEHLFGSESPEANTWKLAMHIADEINTCMDARMSAFVYWYIRRFYGLIDENGNITDKGYIMSHFSKFVRPGAHRIEADFNLATGLTATAYQSDSNMVVVVVNDSNQPATLNFSVQNIAPNINQMTMFASTANKKMINEGTFEITEGSFSANIEANSIVTLTSDASNGAKYGNLEPIANAGNDIEMEDETGAGVQLTLSGAESSDPDGEITKYSWAYNGLQIATTPTIDVQLQLGTYMYVLTVSDNDGATNTDTININVFNNNSVEIWLEAECAEVGENWDIIDDDEASNVKGLSVKAGVQSTAEASANTADLLVYNFHVAENGTYKVWGRVKAPTYDDDSFWIRVDNGEWTNWNGLAVKTNWEWAAVFAGSADNHITYALDTGWHTLSVCFREDGASIDKLLIANTGIIPDGMGADATNCTPDDDDDDDDQNSIFETEHSNAVKIYPNPAHSAVSVISKIAFNQLTVFDNIGRKILVKNYQNDINSDELNLNIPEGIYTIQLQGKKDVINAKLVMINHF